MRRLIVTLLGLALLIPVLSLGEVLYLKDGSTLKGKLLRVEEDVLVFKTSFGAEVRIDREKIARLIFSDSLATLTPAPVPVAASGPGSLMVAFEDVKVSSKISVHRGKDLEGLLRANWIKTSLIVNGQEAWAKIDSTVDKKIRYGPDTHYKNVAEASNIKIGLPAGQYQCEAILRNVGLDDYKDSFVDRPVDYSIILSNVVIRPNETTVIQLKHKGKKLGLSGGSLQAQD